MQRYEGYHNTVLWKVDVDPYFKVNEILIKPTWIAKFQ